MLRKNGLRQGILNIKFLPSLEWLAPLLLLAAVFGSVSCLRRGEDGVSRVQGSIDQSAIDRLLRGTKVPLGKVQQRLICRFPSMDYSFVFPGRSPTPIYAQMAHLPNAISIPFSDLKYEDVMSLERSEDSTFFLKKALDHMEIYAKPLLDLIVKNQAPSSIVVVDFTATGISLGRFMNLFELSMKIRYHKDPEFRDWVDKTHKGFPRLFYFAFSPHSIEEQLKANILKQKRNPIPAKIGTIKTMEAKPGNVLGDRSLKLDTLQYAQMFSALQTPPWEGYQMDLTETPDLTPLAMAFQGSSFDSYAPYGSWTVSAHPLEMQKPAMSPEFLELAKRLKAQRFCWSCLTPRAQ
jgi:hypothetical protein